MTAGSSAPKDPEPVRSGATAPDGRPSGRRASVLGALVLAGGVLVTTSGAWVRSTTTTPVDADVVLAVTGSAAAPGVTAGALVVVAAALALALVGRWGRWPACLTLALGGVLVCAAAIGVVRAPGPVALSAAQEQVGVATLAGPAAATALPWVAVTLGVTAVLLALHAAVTGGRWSRPTDRYRAAPRPDGTGDAAPERGAAPGPPTAAGPVRDEHEAWDALTRGEDPTGTDDASRPDG